MFRHLCLSFIDCLSPFRDVHAVIHAVSKGSGSMGMPHALFRFSLPVLSVAAVISQSTSPLRGEFGFEDAMNWQVIPVFRKLLEG